MLSLVLFVLNISAIEDDLAESRAPIAAPVSSAPRAVASSPDLFISEISMSSQLADGVFHSGYFLVGVFQSIADFSPIYFIEFPNRESLVGNRRDVWLVKAPSLEAPLTEWESLKGQIVTKGIGVHLRFEEGGESLEFAMPKLVTGYSPLLSLRSPSRETTVSWYTPTFAFVRSLRNRIGSGGVNVPASWASITERLFNLAELQSIFDSNASTPDPYYESTRMDILAMEHWLKSAGTHDICERLLKKFSAQVEQRH